MRARCCPCAACSALILGGCIGNIGDPPAGSGDPTDAVKPAALVTGETALRRLTAYEYDRTLHDLLGDDAASAALNLPADQHTPFDNDAPSQDVSQALIEGVELLAGDAAERLLDDPPRRDAIVGCQPSDVHDEVCFRDFITSFGRRALRRPLDETAVVDRMSLLDYADEASDFYVAVGLAVRSFLQDPAFLYRVEVGVEVSPGLRRLDGWETASRLSYLIWASMPDDRLFDLAEGDQLASSAEVVAAAQAMLEDPRALRQIERFHAMWLGYDGLLSGNTDAAVETKALFEKIIGEQRPWADLFRWPETYVTRELAEFYGLDTPAGDAGWVSYGNSGRAGLLSHATFLSIGSQGEVTNPTTRGRLIGDLLLCLPMPDKPANVKPASSAPSSPCKTDVYQAHVQGSCAGCHALMDGIGFGLESYDGTGKFRSNEPDNPDSEDFDESQCALASEGSLLLAGESLPFSGPGELGALLADRGEFTACMVRQFYRFANGRSELDEFDNEFVHEMAARLGKNGLRFEDVVLDLVSGESFLYHRDATEEEAP